MAKNLNFQAPPQLAIAEGDTLPNPGLLGVSVWSTTLGRPVFWNGAWWTTGLEASDTLTLADNASPGAPPAGNVRLFGRNVGGRMLPHMIGPSGLDSALQPHMGRSQVLRSIPVGANTPVNLGVQMSFTGTGLAAGISGSNVHTVSNRVNYGATAAIFAAAGAYGTALLVFRGPLGGKLGGFHFIWRFGPATGAAANATRQFFCGLTSLISAITSANPSTLSNVLGVGADIADANYQLMHGNNVGTVVKVDTGISKAAADATEAYELAMFCPPGGGFVAFEFTSLALGQRFTYTATSELPIGAQLLAPRLMIGSGGTNSAVSIAHYGLYIEKDF